MVSIKGKIMKINNIKNSIPYTINFKQNTQTETTPDFFRDSELFDERKDKTNYWYRHYDYNDMPVYRNKKRFIDSNYLQAYALTDTPRYNIDTSLMELEYLIPDEIQEPDVNEIKTTDKLLEIAATLKTTKGFAVSKPLLNYLKELHKSNRYSARELANVCEVCRLKKADKSEYIDKEMFETGLYWADRIVTNDNSAFRKILRIMVKKDKDGNEYFDSHKNEMLKKLNIKSDLFEAIVDDNL